MGRIEFIWTNGRDEAFILKKNGMIFASQI